MSSSSEPKKPVTSSCPQLDIVTKVGPSDVLIGRGSRAMNNPGNVFYRALVGEKMEHFRCSLRRKHKDEIARQVLRTIQTRGGRFLQRAASGVAVSPPPGGEGIWHAVSEQTSLEKVKQALRDRSREENTPPSSSATSSAARFVAPPPQQQQPPHMGIINNPSVVSTGSAVPGNASGLINAVPSAWAAPTGNPDQAAAALAMLLRQQQLVQGQQQQQQQQRQQKVDLILLQHAMEERHYGRESSVHIQYNNFSTIFWTPIHHIITIFEIVS